MDRHPHMPRNRCVRPTLADILPLLPEDFTCELVGEPLGRPSLADVDRLPAALLVAEDRFEVPVLVRRS